ncbi:transposase [Streptomyces sp. NPDC059398]|uniref:IS110 family transposase n=1 Tax=Streptomyces sp. NPDC059398 TaxID=3346820 RepID=UPI0036A7E321
MGLPASSPARLSPLSVTPDTGCHAAQPDGLTMRCIAALCPGKTKTDAREAAVTADAARSMPPTLRGIELTDGTVAKVEMTVGFDDDLADEATPHRQPPALTAHPGPPAPGMCSGTTLDHPAVLDLLERSGSSATLRKAGSARSEPQSGTQAGAEEGGGATGAEERDPYRCVRGVTGSRNPGFRGRCRVSPRIGPASHRTAPSRPAAGFLPSGSPLFHPCPFCH